MAMTREQADKIEIDEEVIVGFSGTGGDVCAEQLAKWAYRRLKTWPDLLETCEANVSLFGTLLIWLEGNKEKMASISFWPKIAINKMMSETQQAIAKTNES